jgi:ATP-dependent Clp protease ATP-binding subunit ClpX
MTVCERVFRDIKFELPSSAVKRFVVTGDLVDQPKLKLQEMLADPAQEQRLVARQLVQEFARRFFETHAINIRFTDAATDLLVDDALKKGQPVRDLCAARFKDYQFGLQLILRNSGPREFVIDRDAVDAPDKILSEWVVASYRPA